MLHNKKLFIYYFKADCKFKIRCLPSVLVMRVCGSVRVWLALLPHLHAWSLRWCAPVGDVSPLSGFVTTRMTVVTVQMRSAHPPAPQTSSAVPAGPGESRLTSLYKRAPFLWVYLKDNINKTFCIFKARFMICQFNRVSYGNVCWKIMDIQCSLLALLFAHRKFSRLFNSLHGENCRWWDIQNPAFVHRGTIFWNWSTIFRKNFEDWQTSDPFYFWNFQNLKNALFISSPILTRCHLVSCCT